MVLLFIHEYLFLSEFTVLKELLEAHFEDEGWEALLEKTDTK